MALFLIRSSILAVADLLTNDYAPEMNEFENEIRRGKRFLFGENWREFLKELNQGRIGEAERSLTDMLNIETLEGKSFLDIGSGSGLFSLAARRLGAEVHSFDYDPSSVWCTNELRRRYFPDDKKWIVEQGSVLDEYYLKSLGAFDIVYSWGVLHHTGHMWQAMKMIAPLVLPGGLLYIALYNDQGLLSLLWKLVKRTYCHVPRLLKPLIHIPIGAMMWAPNMIRDLIRFRPLETWRSYYHSRGMSPWRDVIDWVGGYPYEVAIPNSVISFYEQQEFLLLSYRSIGTGSGNNQFVFRKI